MFPVNKGQYFDLDTFPLHADDRAPAADLSFKQKLSKLFCCFSPSQTLEDRESEASTPRVDLKKKKIKNEKRRESVESTDSEGSSQGSRSSSRTPTPPPEPSTPLVVARPAVSYGSTANANLLSRLQQGQDQPMARAIHAQKSATVVKAAEVRMQPRAETIERLVQGIQALSSNTPVVTVSHQIGEEFQVHVVYTRKDGPLPGAKGKKTYLIPVEEIRSLGSSSTTTILDLGAHLRAHLRENFSHITIK
ncbi:MAG: hypothetical protein K1X28_06750 [Parachlamydiales bacterium]|nr:hypothetical protein [Parachlamydiales bacterium]